MRDSAPVSGRVAPILISVCARAGAVATAAQQTAAAASFVAGRRMSMARACTQGKSKKSNGGGTAATAAAQAVALTANLRCLLVCTPFCLRVRRSESCGIGQPSGTFARGAYFRAVIKNNGGENER